MTHHRGEVAPSSECPQGDSIHTRPVLSDLGGDIPTHPPLEGPHMCTGLSG